MERAAAGARDRQVRMGGLPDRPAAAAEPIAGLHRDRQQQHERPRHAAGDVQDVEQRPVRANPARRAGADLGPRVAQVDDRGFQEAPARLRDAPRRPRAGPVQRMDRRNARSGAGARADRGLGRDAPQGGSRQRDLPRVAQRRGSEGARAPAAARRAPPPRRTRPRQSAHGADENAGHRSGGLALRPDARARLPASVRPPVPICRPSSAAGATARSAPTAPAIARFSTLPTGIGRSPPTSRDSQVSPKASSTATCCRSGIAASTSRSPTRADGSIGRPPTSSL